jgi:hypothetical protein
MLLFNGDAFLSFSNLSMPPADGFTFETWLRTCDTCLESTILSYAVAPYDAVLLSATSARFMKLCRDFQDATECNSAYARWSTYSNRIERNFATGAWQHLAVTWSAAANGTASVYRDGLLVTQLATGKTTPLPSDGVWLIGGLHSRTGLSQAFAGALDSMRLWRVARTQQQILDSLYLSGSDIASAPGLVAAWDVDEELGAPLLLDAGPWKNHLRLISPPTFTGLTVTPDGGVVPVPSSEAGSKSSALLFHATRAIARNASGLPPGSFTVDLFVQTAAAPLADDDTPGSATMALFSYAAVGGDAKGQGFLDNAILIQLLNSGFYYDDEAIPPSAKALRGNLDVWVNAGSRAGRTHEDASGLATGELPLPSRSSLRFVLTAWHIAQDESYLTRRRWQMDVSITLPSAGQKRRASCAHGSTASPRAHSPIAPTSLHRALSEAAMGPSAWGRTRTVQEAAHPPRRR